MAEQQKQYFQKTIKCGVAGKILLAPFLFHIFRLSIKKQNFLILKILHRAFHNLYCTPFVHKLLLVLSHGWFSIVYQPPLQHLPLENNRFFHCLSTSNTFVRKTYQILGVNSPLMHSNALVKIHRSVSASWPDLNCILHPWGLFSHSLPVSLSQSCDIWKAEKLSRLFSSYYTDVRKRSMILVLAIFLYRIDGIIIVTANKNG